MASAFSARPRAAASRAAASRAASFASFASARRVSKSSSSARASRAEAARLRRRDRRRDARVHRRGVAFGGARERGDGASTRGRRHTRLADAKADSDDAARLDAVAAEAKRRARLRRRRAAA